MKNKNFSEFFATLRKRKYFRISSAAVTAVFLAALVFPGWLFYHKPAFRGRVLDAVTEEPVEGAAVVVVYHKQKIVYNLFLRVITANLGGDSGIIEVRETLTDKNGEFRIPSYTTLINPLTREGRTGFLIFKPGYGNFPNYETSPPNLSAENEEKFFSESLSGVSGTVKEKWSGKIVPVTFGIVKMPKLKTWKERWKASFISIDFPETEWPLLHKMLRKEDEWLSRNKGGQAVENKSRSLPGEASERIRTMEKIIMVTPKKRIEGGKLK